MRPGRIVMRVIGCLVALPAAVLLFLGGAFLVGRYAATDDDGHLRAPIASASSWTAGYMITVDPGTPAFVVDPPGSTWGWRSRAGGSQLFEGTP